MSKKRTAVEEDAIRIAKSELILAMEEWSATQKSYIALLMIDCKTMDEDVEKLKQGQQIQDSPKDADLRDEMQLKVIRIQQLQSKTIRLIVQLTEAGEYD